jgi:hypothetical protein
MKKINSIILLVLIILSGCSGGKIPNDGIGYFVLTMDSGSDEINWFSSSGPTVIWTLNLINCSDYTAKDINFYQNSSKYPFLEIDSIPPHSIKKIWRNEYKPKIIVSKDTLRWEYSVKGKHKKASWILSEHSSLKGEYEAFDEIIE